MIYDCFNFFDELELLDLRLNELNEIVDKFVLVESTVTFTNKKKKLFYLENKHKFSKFQKKIIHIIVDDSPNVGNPWIIENHQLSAVSRGLSRCLPSDTILVSCIDEIPRKEKILEYKNRPGKHKAFLQIMTRYFLNLSVKNQNPWEGTRMFKYKDLLSFSSPYVARFSPIDARISNGGWHFTYLGGVKKIQQKLESFSHQEYNNVNYNTAENILKAIAAGKDLFDPKIKLHLIDNKFLPQYILNNKNQFKGMFFVQNDVGIKNKFMIFYWDLIIKAKKIKKKYF